VRGREGELAAERQALAISEARAAQASQEVEQERERLEHVAKDLEAREGALQAALLRIEAGSDDVERVSDGVRVQEAAVEALHERMAAAVAGLTAQKTEGEDAQAKLQGRRDQLEDR